MAILNRLQKNTLALSVLCTTLTLSGCGGGGGNSGSNTSTPSTQKVSIEFAALAGTLPIKCGEKITNIGSTSATVELKDLRFYVSNVHLMNAADQEVPITLDSNEWQADGVTLVDLEDGTGLCKDGTAATNLKVTGTVPTGTYTGVGYTVGVPAALSHSDVAAAKAPLDVQAMAWSWQSGRKFLKIEINPDAGVTTPATATTAESTSSTFNVHLGSTGCTGAFTNGAVPTCLASNRMAFHSHNFDANTQKIGVDLQSLLATSNVTLDNGAAQGCMSGKADPECAAVFDKLKIDQASGEPIDGGHDQGLFKVVSK